MGEADVKEAQLMVGQRQLLRIGAGVQKVKSDPVLALDSKLDRAKGQKLTKNAIEARVEYDILEDGWRLLHPEVLRVGQQMTWKWQDSYDRFNRVCQATGTTAAMQSVGIKEGDTVIVGDHCFRYTPSSEGKESRMLMYDNLAPADFKPTPFD